MERDELEGVIAAVVEEARSWLHVDGAFGLFAQLTPSTARLAAGVERAQSVIADGHTWLNVPYDCGFAFVRDGAELEHSFGLTAAYLPLHVRTTWTFSWTSSEISGSDSLHDWRKLLELRYSGELLAN